MATVFVLTISDKGARGERVDIAGPAVKERLERAGFSVTRTGIIPDELEQIKTALIEAADETDVNLVLTVGGTGFAPRDVTPEATMAVCEKLVPGIPEAMRVECLKITNRAMLSRSAAGIRKHTLIVNLPGSEKAALENLNAVIDSLQHGIDMLTRAKNECAANPPA